ncbi:GGDEF domain-containing protein [Paracoccus luteus]|uniref:GGDEF domain-containing protein n=1 Tax=Paracoccus luteus TaxID=2508543 RepID=UPI00106F927F|nr:GGDEF domain-containing protein [Paracoccus luteus]
MIAAADVVAMLCRLMPMHLWLDRVGAIRSAGPTLRKLIGDAADFGTAFEVIGGAGADLSWDATGTADRLFLRLRSAPQVVLRGRGAALPFATGAPGEGALINLGFGIGLGDGVRQFALTDQDFAPAELAMELLFLSQANAAMMAELSRFNLRLEEARMAAEAQALTDPLTGVFNRRGLTIAVEAALLGAGAAGGPGFALLHIDLDLFKAVNDTHGHAAGDAVLRAVAARLSAETRLCDSVARMGGDEFVLLLPGLTDADKLLKLARRIIERVEEPVRVAEADCRISASIGAVVSTWYDTLDAQRMQRDADAALYAAKAGGRGAVVLADATSRKGAA